MATKQMTADQMIAMLDNNPELAKAVKVKQAENAKAAKQAIVQRRQKVGLHKLPVTDLKPEWNTIAKAEYVIKHEGKAYVFTGSIVMTEKGTESVSLTNERKPSYVPGDITKDCDDCLTQAILKAKAAKPITKYLQAEWDKKASKHEYVEKA